MIVALVAIVLASAYMLRLYQGVMNGPRLPIFRFARDLSWMEGLARCAAGARAGAPRRQSACADHVRYSAYNAVASIAQGAAR